MFERSKQKIVMSIMTVMIILLIGTLSVIYVFSYVELYHENQEHLAHHVARYEMQGKPDLREPRSPKGMKPGRPSDRPEKFGPGEIYSVRLDGDGMPLDVENSGSSYSDEALVRIAQKALRGDAQGTIDGMQYCRGSCEEGTLVALMSNTVLQESFTTLFRYMLIFGSAAILCVFFLARSAAEKIVRPLEENYQKQRQFISDAGHELKTPIAVVSANAELLQRELGENRWLANIRHENDRMGSLVEQMLELARTEMIKPATEPLDLSRLVAGGALPFEGVAFEAGLTLRLDIAEHIVRNGNREQLNHLLSILLDNAIRHGQGGKEVAVSLRSSKGAAVLAVTNDGAPIPPEKMAQLFERFYRIDEARSGTGRHYGLGLAIAKAIVTAHGGKIDVICGAGKVTFRVTL